METRTERSGLTLAAIVDVGLQMAAADGLESLTIGEVARRLGLSKSGVFSRVGSREALQCAGLAGATRVRGGRGVRPPFPAGRLHAGDARAARAAAARCRDAAVVAACPRS